MLCKLEITLHILYTNNDKLFFLWSEIVQWPVSKAGKSL